MMLIPYKLETTFTRIPYANAALIVITSIIFFLPSQIFSYEDFETFVLRDWSLSGLIGSIFLHGGFFHLLGNMLFLWVFGNAVCAAVGNGAYPFIYIFLGMFSGAVHLMADGGPAIGASGAINGIVGMTLVLFPKNKLYSWYWFFIPIIWLWKSGTFAIRAYWMVLLWLLFDILGSMGSSDGVAHWAHIGGLAGGVILAFAAVKFNLIETYHHTILDVFSGRDEEEDFHRTLQLEQQIGTVLVPALVPEESSGSDMLPIEAEVSTPVNSPAQVSIPAAAPPSSPPPIVPDIQLKKCVGNGTSVILYFVNNGASMNSMVLRAPQGVTVQMSPAKALRRGESGSIRFSTVDTMIDSVEFIIGYQKSGPERHKIRYRCIPAESRLEIVSSTQENNKKTPE
jgi:membrane associated rhomboid family serine protease